MKLICVSKRVPKSYTPHDDSGDFYDKSCTLQKVLLNPSQVLWITEDETLGGSFLTTGRSKQDGHDVFRVAETPTELAKRFAEATKEN